MKKLPVNSRMRGSSENNPCMSCDLFPVTTLLNTHKNTPVQQALRPARRNRLFHKTGWKNLRDCDGRGGNSRVGKHIKTTGGNSTTFRVGVRFKDSQLNWHSTPHPRNDKHSTDRQVGGGGHCSNGSVLIFTEKRQPPLPWREEPRWRSAGCKEGPGQTQPSTSPSRVLRSAPLKDRRGHGPRR